MKAKKKPVLKEQLKLPVIDQKTLKQQKEGKREEIIPDQQWLINSGIVPAYQSLLSSLCSNGLPKGNIFEYAALHVLKYEKKFKQKQRLELQDRIHLREKNKEIKKLMKSERKKKDYEAEQERIRKEEEEKKAKEEEARRLALEEEMADPFLRRGYKNFNFKQKNGSPPPKKGAPVDAKKAPEAAKGKKGKKK